MTVIIKSISLALVLTVLIAISLFFIFEFKPGNNPKNHPGNDKIYHLKNIEPIADTPLEGKTILFLGSSITLGSSSLGVSFADYIGKRNNVEIIKEAVSGTTLTNVDENSYVSRLVEKVDKNEAIDIFVCQLSTNDAGRQENLGAISPSYELEDFDTNTIIGSIEYIIVYAQKTFDCPVVFYTNPRYDNELYGQMVESLNELKNKHTITVIDFWNNQSINQLFESNHKLYMSDAIHPTQAGYLMWTPVMEEHLYSCYEN